MRLVGDPKAPRLMTVRTKVDLTVLPGHLGPETGGGTGAGGPARLYFQQQISQQRHGAGQGLQRSCPGGKGDPGGGDVRP